MPAVVRLGDVCTGHGCFPPRASVSGSPDFYVNSRPLVRVGDSWAAHGCPDCIPHGGTQVSGSPNFYVNSRPVARVGDSIDCGSSNAQGSPDFHAN